MSPRRYLVALAGSSPSAGCFFQSLGTHLHEIRYVIYLKNFALFSIFLVEYWCMISPPWWKFKYFVAYPEGIIKLPGPLAISLL